MALEISPRATLDGMLEGEEIAYSLDITNELDSNTINTHTYKIYDSNDTDVTSTFGGGSSESAGVITFGVKATSTGTYTLQFTITCNETLPDASTPYEFIVELTVVIS